MRELFGDRVDVSGDDARRVRRAGRRARATTASFFKRTFGPVVAIYAPLADRPDRIAALDRDFLEFATRFDRGAPGGPAEYRYEYLLVVARTRAA